MHHLAVGLLVCAAGLLQVAAAAWFWRRLATTLGTDDLTGLRNRAGLHAPCVISGWPQACCCWT
ncbi:hypothetical protein ABT369_50380 [Dactylosporangium sp. NPDC000244]|uniref:hypothetical protein n=1 Tax=Dactylosporangium sp. NPDC000244 TaxID=3154365 RepID=UPI00331D2FDE